MSFSKEATSFWPSKLVMPCMQRNLLFSPSVNATFSRMLQCIRVFRDMHDRQAATLSGPCMTSLHLVSVPRPEGIKHACAQVAGDNGIGRVDIVESRFVGMKSRGVYETPGGTILLTARRAVESICLDRGELHLKVGEASLALLFFFFLNLCQSG